MKELKEFGKDIIELFKGLAIIIAIALLYELIFPLIYPTSDMTPERSFFCSSLGYTLYSLHSLQRQIKKIQQQQEAK